MDASTAAMAFLAIALALALLWGLRQRQDLEDVLGILDETEAMAKELAEEAWADGMNAGERRIRQQGYEVVRSINRGNNRVIGRAEDDDE